MTTHADHSHVHGAGCGHTAVQHDGHIDFLHNGHLHHQSDSTTTEHSFAVSDAMPDACTPSHKCGGHDAAHVHGADCGHPAVPHGDHVDYLVDGHLHHPHADHCDFHGALTTVA